MRTAIGFVLLSLIAGCASVPEPIRKPVPGPSVAQARQEPDKHIGQQVRWGGRILQVDNGKDATTVHVLGRNLTRDGRPIDDDYTPGRFIASVPGFLEPNQYQRGREVTVVGVVESSATETVGEHPYRYPVVRVEAIHLWREVADTYYDPYPYRYPYYYGDPFYYPYRYYPYYHRPFFHFRGNIHNHGHRHDNRRGRIKSLPGRKLHIDKRK